MKSAGLAPLKLMPAILMAVALELVRVTTFWPPLFPVATAAHDRLAGETVAAFAHAADASANNSTETSPASARILEDGSRRSRAILPGNSLDGVVSTNFPSRQNADSRHILPPKGLHAEKTHEQKTVKASSGFSCGRDCDSPALRNLNGSSILCYVSILKFAPRHKKPFFG